MFKSENITFDDPIFFNLDFENIKPEADCGYKQFKHHEVVDINTFYRVNSHGFRGEEISGDEDIVIGGCSFTFGLGIPEEKSWGVQVANNLNLKYANLAYPGASVMFIVQSIFAYFKKHGNPKTLICLFPDSDRMVIPHVDKKLESLDNPNKAKLSHLHLKGFFGDRIPSYSKLPHLAEHVIPKDVARWLSIQYIHMLEQYCKSSGIKFIWSSWETDFLKSLLDAKKELNIFDGLIDTEMHKWKRDEVKYFDKYIDDNCHLDLQKEYADIFHSGSDTEWGKKYAHWGVHKHAHISEIFEIELNK
jgi:hypothetical protein